MSEIINLRKKATIYLIGFFGFVGFSIALPVFSVMFGGSSPPPFIESLGDQKEKYLGLLLALYPIGQFLAFPFIGRLSDIYGRKPILLLTISLVIPSTLLTAFSINIGNLKLLFLSRFLSGFFEASIPISNAALSDLSHHRHEKAMNFGYLLSFMSAGYLIGPLIGGFLSRSGSVGFFSYATPFLFSALMSLLMFFLITTKFKETLIEKKEKGFSLDKNLLPLIGIFSFKKLRLLFIGCFFIYLTSQSFYVFLPLYLVRTFNFSSINIGLSEAFIAFFILFAPLVHKKASLYLSHKRILRIASLALAINIAIVLLARTSFGVILALFPIGILIAITFTYTQAMVSERASKKTQGEAIAFNESLVVLAEIMASFSGGFLAGSNLVFPMIFAIFFALLCFFWFLFPLKNN